MPNPPIKWKLQHLPPRANPGHLTIFCARAVGNLTFAFVGWGKLNQKCQMILLIIIIIFFFFWGGGRGGEVANSYKTYVWTSRKRLKEEM